MYMYIFTLPLQHNLTWIQLHPVHIASVTPAGLHVSCQMAITNLPYSWRQQSPFKRWNYWLVQIYQTSLCTFTSHHPTHHHTRIQPWKFLSSNEQFKVVTFIFKQQDPNKSVHLLSLLIQNTCEWVQVRYIQRTESASVTSCSPTLS